MSKNSTVGHSISFPSVVGLLGVWIFFWEFGVLNFSYGSVKNLKKKNCFPPFPLRYFAAIKRKNSKTFKSGNGYSAVFGGGRRPEDSASCNAPTVVDAAQKLQVNAAQTSGGNLQSASHWEAIQVRPCVQPARRGAQAWGPTRWIMASIFSAEPQTQIRGDPS